MDFSAYQDDAGLQEVFTKNFGNLDDFVSARIYFDDLPSQPQKHKAYLYSQAARITAFLDKDLEQYLWQRDAFVLEPVLEDTDVSHLLAHIRYGDNISDCWYLISLMKKLSVEFEDLIIQIVDRDGDPILVEAANVIPKWVQPSCADNRVFVREGAIHLLEDSKHMPKGSNKLGLELSKALIRLRNADGKDLATPAVQRVIDVRCKKAKQMVQESKHMVRAVVPPEIARLLICFPQLISTALDHLPPVSRPKTYEDVNFHKGGVPVQLRMTRLQYGRLMHSRFALPGSYQLKHWANVGDNSSRQLGAKICLGLQQAYADDAPSSALGFARLPDEFLTDLKPIGDLDVDHLKASTRAAHSVRLAELAKERKGFQKEFDGWYARAQVQYPGDLAEFDKPGDSDDWMTLEPEELDEVLKQRTEMPAATEADAEAMLKEMTEKMANLLKGASGLDGIDLTAENEDGDEEDDEGMFSDDEDMEGPEPDSDGEDMDDVDGLKDEEVLAAMREMDAQLAECQEEDKEAPGLEHVDPKKPGLDMHVMKHLLESYCAEHKMDPGPTSLLFDQLKK